jgi:hypothetical protein
MYKMAIDEQVLYPIEAACEQWDDNRVMHVDDLVDLVLWIGYGQKVISQNGMRLKGFQLRQRDDLWLLSVKVVEAGVPLVGFWSAANPMGCISMLLRHLEEDRVRWNRDKYPWN